jgi:hypothetical protein
MYRGTIQRKNPGNERGKSRRGGLSGQLFPFVCVSRTLGDGGPHALEVTGDLDKEERRGRCFNDLGAGLTGCGGGIDERPREKGVLPSLSPPMFGKTEVTRELD